ncbi:Esterase FE4 [Gryllus bimaculatus]|nr:Esterase FE4 [Gryllus bimaculatus]
MAEEFAIVLTAYGALRGRKVTAKAGNSYFSFQGVPYAKPPVGPLRFKVAQPVEPWSGIRNALKEGPCCPQIELIMNLPYRGNEDCLYINVYSPKLPSTGQILNYPVMVWIHGGGFEMGSGDSNTYGPEYLVNENVVIVTFNYRLGIFGFLNVDDGSTPYNVGLKDQVAALRWVKKNISVFGGDPNNVTIFGESAGGASVHFHMLSPVSKGLFHKAILQSGCALNEWKAAAEPQEVAFIVAQKLGCDAADVQGLVSFLSSVSARDLVEKYNEYSASPGEKGSFRPMPEKPIPDDDVFLPTDARELMENRQFCHVPVMIGLNSKETIIFLDMMGVRKNPENVKNLIEHIGMFIPKSMGLNSEQKEKAVKEFYFGQETRNERLVEALINCTSDMAIARGVEEATKILSEGYFPVFYYNFNFSGKLNIFKHFVSATELPGASHLDELGYLFATPFFNVPEVASDSPEALVRKRMVKLWTNFAKTGNPTPKLDPEINVKWPPYNVQNAEYLSITDTLSIQNHYNKERMDFLNNL